MIHPLTGSCLCGSVRYVVRGQPMYITHCHCPSCRKASGAAFVTWFTVRASEVEWRGEPMALYRSSAAVERGFCRRCGTTLTYRHESDPAELDLALATLDQPESLVPESHTWWQDHLAWADPAVLGHLPVFERSREEAEAAEAAERRTAAVG